MIVGLQARVLSLYIEFQFIDKAYSLSLSTFMESEFSPASSTDNLASSSSTVGMVSSTFSG